MNGSFPYNPKLHPNSQPASLLSYLPAYLLRKGRRKSNYLRNTYVYLKAKKRKHLP